MSHYIGGPKYILVEKFSRLQRLIYQAKLAKGKKLIEPVSVSDDESSDDA